LAGDERFRYLIIGGVNTGFAFLFFAGLLVATRDVLHYLAVLVITHVVTTFTAYLTQRTFVFQVKDRFWGDLPRFWSVYLIGLGLNGALLGVFVEILQLPVLWAQALVTIILAVGTYFAHKYVSFRRPSVPPVPSVPGGSEPDGDGRVRRDPRHKRLRR
jgi:putative flippase GtrA